MTIRTVGVAGLGSMGAPLARHVARAGFEVSGYDVRQDACAAVAADGIAPVHSCKELTLRSDLVIIGVGFDSEVETVIFGNDGLLTGDREDLIIAVASTISPAAMKSLAARATPHILLDIPMCRGEQAARNGELLIMGGGDKVVFDRCRAVFESFASTIHYPFNRHS